MALANLFGSGKSPSKAAQPFFNQIPGAVKPYYEPYVEAGRGARESLPSQYGNMASNPVGSYEDIRKSYSPSAGYQQKEKRLTDFLRSKAGAGGYVGAPDDLRESGDLMSALMDEGFQQYFNNVTGLQKTGLEGQQHLFDSGQNASTGLGDILGTNLANQGTLAYQGQAQENQNNSGLMQGILQLLGTLGGAAIGGPPGAMAGGSLAGLFGGGNKVPIQAGGMNAMNSRGAGGFTTRDWGKY